MTQTVKLIIHTTTSMDLSQWFISISAFMCFDILHDDLAYVKYSEHVTVMLEWYEHVAVMLEWYAMNIRFESCTC